MIAGSLELELFANVARLTKDMEDAKRVVGGAMSSIDRAVSTTKTLLAGLGAGALAVSFARQIKETINYADELNKLSQRTGFAAETLSQLHFAAKLADVSNERLTMSLRKLNESVALGLAGDKEKLANFKALGITTADLGKGTEAVMFKMADAYQNAANGAGKVYVNNQLLGKGADEMIPLLNGGAQAIRDLMKEADKLGLTIGSDFAAKAEEFNDNMTRVEASSRKLYITLAGDLVDGLGKAMKAMADATIEGGKLHGIMVGLRTLIYGDERHQANVDMVDAADRILNLQNAIDKARAAGDNATVARREKLIAQYKREFELYRQNAAALDKVTEDAKAAAQKLKDGQKPVNAPNTAASSEYDNLIKRINERIALSKEEAARSRELTEEEKFAAKALQDLAGMKHGASAASVAHVKALLKESDALFQQNKLRADMVKLLSEGMKFRDQQESELGADAAARATERDRVNKSIADQAQALAESNAALQLEKTLIGATDAERQVALGNMKVEQGVERELLALKQNLLLNEEQRAKARAGIYANAEAAKAQLAERAALEEQVTILNKIEGTAHDVWTNIWEGGSNVFKKLGQTLKASLLDLLYQMTVKKWIFNIFANLTGGSGGGISSIFGGGGGAAGGLSGLGSIAGVASMLKTGWASFTSGGLSGMATTIKSSIASMFGGSGGAALGGPISMPGAFGPAAGGAMPGLAAGAGSTSVAVIPIVGWIAAGMMAAKGLYERGWDARNGSLNTVGKFSPEMMLGDNLLTKLGISGKTAAILSGSSVISALFGRKNPEVKAQGLEGTFATNGFSGQTYADMFAKGGLFRSDKNWTEHAPVSAELQTMLATSLVGIGATAKAVAESLNIGTAALDSFSQQLTITFGKTDEETQKAIEDALAGWQEDLYEALDPSGAVAKLQRSGEALSGTFARLVGDLLGVNQILLQLDQTSLDLSLTGATAASNLVELFGSIEQYAQLASGYLQSFYTEAERSDITWRGLVKSFAAFGIVLPSTIAAYRQVTEAQDRSTEAGQRAYAFLLQNSAAFATLYPLVEATNSALEEQAKLQDDLRNDLMDAYNRESNALQDVINKNKGYIAALEQLQANLSRGPLAQLSPASAYDKMRAEFLRLNALAPGDEERLANLPAVSEAFLQASQQYNASSVQYFKDLDMVMGAAQASKQYAKANVDVSQLQLNVLKSQMVELGLIKDEVKMGFDELLAAYKATLNPLGTGGVNAVTGGVAGSIAGKGSWDAAGNITFASGNTASAADVNKIIKTAKEGAALVDTYLALLGRTPDRGTYDYYAGKSQAEIEAMIKGSAEYKAIPGHASGLWSVPYDNYLMFAHQGERILNRADAEVSRSGASRETDELLRGVNDRLDHMAVMQASYAKRDLQNGSRVARSAENTASATKALYSRPKTTKNFVFTV